LPPRRLDLYKLAHIEARTLLACGWSPSEISVEALYKRLLEDETYGEGANIPTKREFKLYEKECRKKGIEPYRL
jgi:hypothetical protein